MTRPKKNPQKRTRTPAIPPAPRSRAAIGLAVAAAEGRFALQHCADCGAVAYPPRDLCGACLSPRLEWRDTDPAGQLIAETAIRATPDPYFRERLPWRIGTVEMRAGPSVIAHLAGPVARGDTVRLTMRLDAAGNGVLIAMPTDKVLTDDPQLRAMGADPRNRRALIADARAPDALALTRALFDAGAAGVTLGEAESWRGNPARDALLATGAQIVPLDMTDASSCHDLAGTIAGRVEIVINNARLTRPGGPLDRADTVMAARETDLMVLGQMRLAQALGPALMARAADGDDPACAWVNILPHVALVPDPDFGCLSAAAAGALALSRSLRARMRGAGIRVIHVFTGPVDDDWHQPLPPPKLAPKAVAGSVVTALRDGTEEVFVGDIARETAELFTENAALLIRERTGGTT